MLNAVPSIDPSGGLEHTRFGDLRHYAVTQMLYAGIPIPTVAARVGHATPVTALAIYGHALPVDGHDAADVLAVMLDRATARRGVLTPSTY